MDKKENDSPSDTRDSASREKEITRRESAVIDAEAAVLSREKLVTQRKDTLKHREKTADSREDTVYRREGTASLREQEIRRTDTGQAASDERSIMLQQANSRLVVSVIEANKLAEQVETTKSALHHLAHHDVLTGLPNRMLLQDRLSQAIELARRQGTQLAVLFMDLDRFKHINDSLGHAVGDRLLKSVAQRLADSVRHSDTISRQGGDEFVVLLSTIKRAEDAALSAQKILAALAVPHLIDQHELHVSVSVGISIYPDDGQDAEILLEGADSAMYHAKEGGRNNYKFFEPEMSERAVQRQSIEASLRLALEHQEFVLYYQPKINVHSSRIIGAEALIRWQHPQWGVVPSSQFVPIAEASGLIVPIGHWVLREACLQARSWQEIALDPITVSINISARELNAPDFLESVRATLHETKLEPKYLEMEFTEQVIMRDAAFTDSVLEELAELGIKLTIDDFGIGYSSLNFLRRSSIHALKIDQSFVKRMVTSADDAAIVSAVISMGKNLDLRIIAAGVETAEQYASLVAHQCEEGQGYFFGLPMEAEAFAGLLQSGALPLLRI